MNKKQLFQRYIKILKYFKKQNQEIVNINLIKGGIGRDGQITTILAKLEEADIFEIVYLRIYSCTQAFVKKGLLYNELDCAFGQAKPIENSF